MRIAVVFSGAVALSCAAAPQQQRRVSLLDGISVAPEYPSPAIYRYHPRDAGRLTPGQTLDDGSQLWLGERGERWLLSPSGRAETAGTLAPERLVDAVAPGTGFWLFVGLNGGIYEARSPLGAFFRASLPSAPLVRVAVTPQAMLGVTLDGGVLRSLDWGASWQPTQLAGHGVDVELLANGRGLLLALPEQLYETEDHGNTFTKLNVAPFGAVTLRARGETIEVGSLLAGRSFTPGAASPWGEPGAASSIASFNPTLPLGPSADAMVRSRAAVSQGHYYQLNGGDQGWVLKSGRITEGLSRREAPEFDDCQELQLVAREQTVVVLCAESDENATELSLFLSSDGAQSFDLLPLRPLGTQELLRAQLLSKDQLLLSGVCAAESSSAGCLPSGVHRLDLTARQDVPAEEEAASPLSPARVPSLDGTALGMAVSADAQRVLLLGKRTKGTSLGVFASRDGGRTFTTREIAELDVGRSASYGDLRVLSFNFGGDGYVSAVVIEPSSSQQMLLLLDEDGRFISLSAAPIVDAVLGAFGLKALAVVHPGGDVFESLDGGADWAALGRAPALDCADGGCSVSCFATGCAVAEAVTRVGWEGQEGGSLNLRPETRSVTSNTRAMQSTAVCRFAAGSSWAKVAAEVVPDAGAAALGDSAWFTFDADFREVSADFHEMPFGRTPTLKTSSLLAPSKVPQGTALLVSQQLEGVAVLRQTDEQGIEIAWKNLFERGAVRRARFTADVEVPVRVTPFPARLAQPVALTIAQGGIFFAPNAGSVYFADGSTVQSLSASSWPASIMPGRDDILRVGDARLRVRFFESGAGIAWTSLRAQQAATAAMSVGLPRAEDFGVTQELSVVYLGERPGLLTTRRSDHGEEAQVYPFVEAPSILGAAIPVPTQGSLGSVPAPCADSARRNSPRIIATPEPGTRHAVVVNDPSEPMPTLLTSAAVLHGSREQPCAVAFDAEAVSNNEPVSALVFTDAETPSWLFRKAGEGSDGILEFRAMSCGFDPRAEVPEEVFGAAGTER